MFKQIIHELDPRVKIFLLFVVSLLVVILSQPKTLCLLFVATLIPYFFIKLSRQKIKILTLLLVLGMWGTMFSQALFYSQEPRSILWVLIHPQTPFWGTLTGGIFVYKEGFVYGAVQALRFSSMVSLGLLLCWTTDPRDFLLGFLKWKIPYELAFMTITALRFLPLLAQETQTVLTAQRLRGFRAVKGGGIKKTIQTSLHLFLPILANCVRRAGNLAVAAESRAFRAQEERSYFRKLKYNWLDKFILLGLTIGLTFLCLAKFLYCMYFNGFCYFSSLRYFYDFAQNWL